MKHSFGLELQNGTMVTRAILPTPHGMAIHMGRAMKHYIGSAWDGGTITTILIHTRGRKLENQLYPPRGYSHMLTFLRYFGYASVSLCLLAGCASHRDGTIEKVYSPDGQLLAVSSLIVTRGFGSDESRVTISARGANPKVVFQGLCRRQVPANPKIAWRDNDTLVIRCQIAARNYSGGSFKVGNRLVKVEINCTVN